MLAPVADAGFRRRLKKKGPIDKDHIAAFSHQPSLIKRETRCIHSSNAVCLQERFFQASTSNNFSQLFYLIYLLLFFLVQKANYILYNNFMLSIPKKYVPV